MPEAQINQMGLQAFDNLKKQKPISSDKKLNKLANCITDAITEQAGNKWEVIVFEDDSPNAFALPGNKIGIHTGMLALIDNNQEQLAAVIGHEVGHVRAQHSNERASQEFAVTQGINMIQAISAPETNLGKTAIGLLGIGAQYGILMPYSRAHETEADTIGADLMAKAGFDPKQSVVLWEKMDQAFYAKEPLEFLSTHPSNSSRIQDLKEHMPEALKLFKQAQSSGKHPHCN